MPCRPLWQLELICFDFMQRMLMIERQSKMTPGTKLVLFEISVAVDFNMSNRLYRLDSNL